MPDPEEIQIELPLMGAENEERSSGYGSITQPSVAASRNNLFPPAMIGFCSPERIRGCSTIGRGYFSITGYWPRFLCLAAAAVVILILFYKLVTTCDENPALAICKIKMPTFS